MLADPFGRNEPNGHSESHEPVMSPGFWLPSPSQPPTQKDADPSPTARAPNGIRTRAAALKGRCPRPLDDGGAVGFGRRRRHQPAVGTAPAYGKTPRTSKADRPWPRRPGFRRYLLQTSTASDTVSDMKITQSLERATISTGVTGRRGGSCMLDGETGHTPHTTLA